MCQVNNTLVKLKKDMVAYKIEIFREGRWRTPFQFNLIKRNKVNTAKGELFINDDDEINGGAFHCYINKEGALYNSRNHWWSHIGITRVVKVIIPAKYNIVYEGYFNDQKSICAKKIILTDEVVK